MNDPDPHTTPSDPAGPTPWTAPPGSPQGPPPAPGGWGPTPTAPPQWNPPPSQWGSPSPYGAAPGPAYQGQAPAQPYVATGWAAQGSPAIASPGVRIGAKVIDVIIIVVVQVVVGVVVGLIVGAAAVSSGGVTTLTGDTDPFSGVSFTAAIIGGLIGLAIDFVYNVVLVARFGGQPGKLLLGLRIVTVDGAAPSTGVAFRRWTPVLLLLVIGLVPLISVIAGLLRLVLAIANLVLIFADDRRRDVFDHVAGTLVVSTR